MDECETTNFPKRVAIVMDGNRRYEEKMRRLKGEAEVEKGYGHRMGLLNARSIARAAKRFGVKQLTYWGGSKSNLENRPEEVPTFFGLLSDEMKFQMRNREPIFFRLCGQYGKYAPNRMVLKQIQAVHKKTAKNKGKGQDLTALFGYNGRDEIVEMVRKIVALGVRPEEVSHELVRKHLWTSHLEDIDLFIRTGVDTSVDPEGDEHWSDPFLPWQINQTRVIFSRKLWPEYGCDDLYSDFKRYALCRKQQRMGA